MRILGEQNLAAAPATATPTKARNETDAPPTAQTQKPPAPPRHMPSSAPAARKDGTLQFGRPDGKAGVEGQSLQGAFERFRKERRRSASTKRGSETTQLDK